MTTRGSMPDGLASSVLDSTTLSTRGLNCSACCRMEPPVAPSTKAAIPKTSSRPPASARARCSRCRASGSPIFARRSKISVSSPEASFTSLARADNSRLTTAVSAVYTFSSAASRASKWMRAAIQSTCGLSGGTAKAPSSGARAASRSPAISNKLSTFSGDAAASPAFSKSAGSEPKATTARSFSAAISAILGQLGCKPCKATRAAGRSFATSATSRAWSLASASPSFALAMRSARLAPSSPPALRPRPAAAKASSKSRAKRRSASSFRTWPAVMASRKDFSILSVVVAIALVSRARRASPELSRGSAAAAALKASSNLIGFKPSAFANSASTSVVCLSAACKAILGCSFPLAGSGGDSFVLLPSYSSANVSKLPTSAVDEAAASPSTQASTEIQISENLTMRASSWPATKSQIGTRASKACTIPERLN
mmetsp:Transcript_129500/g.415101  ORF Transcript_129500/g.415101 Transcript_129500/m.415101 type:complete len:429 (+) Transcript_129500:658-1944(+)